MLWNKEKAPEIEMTFKERVEEFWDWFSGNTDRIYDAIEDGTFDQVQPDISEQVNRMWPHLAWVFGPGSEEKGGHSFTVSGEGILARQFLSEYCVSRAPDLERWTFYASRQPGAIGPEVAIRIGDDDFEFGALWITPKLDEENHKVHITAWHPNFPKVDDNKRDTVLFIMLDEVLGEYGTDQWIGRIEKSDSELDGSFPALELRDYLHDLQIERGWKVLPPTENYASYQINEPDERFLRSDTIAGSSCCMDLVGEYLDANGPVPEGGIEGSGAEFIFISYPTEISPPGQEVDFRGEIEEELTEILEAEHEGRILGGAIGMIHSYIDLIIFGGDKSIRKIADHLKARDLPEGTAIQFFVTGNEGRRIVIS